MDDNFLKLADFLDAPPPGVQARPVAKPENVSAPATSSSFLDRAPGTNTEAPSYSMKPVEIAGKIPGKANAVAPKASKEVKDMQNQLLRIGNEFSMTLPELFHGSETFNKDIVQSLKLDPNLINKIRSISKSTNNALTGYADGVWGKNTQNALNSIYSYVSSMSKLMGKQADEKYTSLLKQLSDIGIGPNRPLKQFNQKDLSKNALAIQKILYNFYGLINEFKDYIAKGEFPKEEVKDEKKENTTLPNQEENKSNQDVSKVNQPTENKSEVVENKNINQEQSVGNYFPNGFPMPFDTTTKQISIDRMEHFIEGLNRAINIPSIQSQMGNNYNVVASYMVNVQNMLNNWKSFAANVPGFEFDTSDFGRVGKFINTFANGDYNKAFNMFNTMSQLCVQLSALVSQLQKIPTLFQFIGKDVIDAQTRIGNVFGTSFRQALEEGRRQLKNIQR